MLWKCIWCNLRLHCRCQIMLLHGPALGVQADELALGGVAAEAQ